jgi:inosine/xanthosine triphosphate pyrophosphatase family protein
MRPEEKFKIDHRSQAFQKIKKFFWILCFLFYKN